MVYSRATGTYSVRYVTMRDNLLSLLVVLPFGVVI
jgi:hypothetical protein